MTLTCKWIKDETGALVMKWTGDGDEISTMKPKMRRLTEFTVMFANNVGDTGAVANFQSDSPTAAVSLWGSAKSPETLLVCTVKPHLDFDRGIQLLVTTGNALHTSFVSHPWRIR